VVWLKVHQQKKILLKEEKEVLKDLEEEINFFK